MQFCQQKEVMFVNGSSKVQQHPNNVQRPRNLSLLSSWLVPKARVSLFTFIGLLPCLLLLMLTGDTTADAQEIVPEERQASLLVGVKPAAPFVMIDKASGEVTGFSIDLIRAVGAEMEPSRTVSFEVYDSISDQLDAVKAGDVDLGIAATSLTSKRERDLDFSNPFYRGGLSVAVRPDGGIKILDTILSSNLLYPICWLTVFVVLCGQAIWYTERGTSNMFEDNWMLGFGQGIWWTIVTMSTVGYGDFVPRKPLSRFLSVIIILAGIALFGIAVGALSSAFTVQKLRADIQGPDDLDGSQINKPVAVVRDTLAEQTIRQRGVKTMSVASLKQALELVEQGEAVAAVHDVALLRYNLPREAPGLVLVGRTFVEHDYGMTFPTGSPLREDVNVALLELMEGNPSVYQQIDTKWFGNGAR